MASFCPFKFLIKPVNDFLLLCYQFFQFFLGHILLLKLCRGSRCCSPGWCTRQVLLICPALVGCTILRPRHGKAWAWRLPEAARKLSHIDPDTAINRPCAVEACVHSLLDHDIPCCCRDFDVYEKRRNIGTPVGLEQHQRLAIERPQAFQSVQRRYPNLRHISRAPQIGKLRWLEMGPARLVP